MPKTWIQYDKTLPYVEEREPHQEPNCYLVKEGVNSYRVVEGRRPSKMLLVARLREEVRQWRQQGYPGATKTTVELFDYWFENDHVVNGEPFNFWFCQREAVETLAYLFECKKYNDLEPVIEDYAQRLRRDLLGNAVEVVENVQGNRKIVRYFPELEQRGEQDLPPKGLLRYAFKMATGSGKTCAMALIIAWSYFNRLREKDKRYADNFLVISPNVIVYQRLEKDFADNRIFNELPLIPPSWRSIWDTKVTLRDDDSPLRRSGNLIVNNIQQLYETREDEWSPKNVVDAILGRKPQKDLAKTPVSLTEKIKLLDNLIIINDEAHHVHDEQLQWHKTLMSIHSSLPTGLTLWLDFSATPKTQTGTYYPWIVVDYPLAQAIEDRIVKAPLIVHRIDRKDPENINSENVVRKYGDWITAALSRWNEHCNVYETVGKKPVLFIMAEKNQYADKLAEAIRKQKSKWTFNLPEEEVLVIHTDTSGEIRKSDLEDIRKAARDIDEKESRVKIIVSVLMLREGWDVRNVTIILGLRPFTSKAEILPEQAVGRGLRLIRGISPDHTQTLEVMGTEAFEKFVKELEKEGVGINTATKPPLPVTIAPEKSRLDHDVEIPTTEFRYRRNYRKVSEIDPLGIPSLYTSRKLDDERKIKLRMSFPVTETVIHETLITPLILLSGRELITYVTKEVMKRAHFTCDFVEMYPIIESYVLQKCFETIVEDIESEKLRIHLSDISIQEAIIDLLAKKCGEITAEPKEVVFKQSALKLSAIEPFIWRRKHLRCKKTVFNFVAVYNDFEAEFAQFLDRCLDIERFAALAGLFKIDYLSSSGAIKLYLPDFVAIQKDKGKHMFWIIETKGREYVDVDRKDKAMERWCNDISGSSGEEWKYVKVPQLVFDSLKTKVGSLSGLLRRLQQQSHAT
jgi:type III restriction enzyme